MFQFIRDVSSPGALMANLLSKLTMNGLAANFRMKRFLLKTVTFNVQTQLLSATLKVPAKIHALRRGPV